ncbi:TetR/AcrR family transcriptional regulator [Paenibacillus apiarius]|uniref:TetR/AcrR family transcriptional regulator n=1 Tax=Paenibacillus apiarius TaxID=46240 RepID=A0ABT4DUL6_9BACL|nr:TetR/AcrR family transcriptional regulator [Paenibacillus apiarius]MCY9514456.1 TetR/AcrR family transcriptional regulator [Paenibacillus apiarius]MCY9521006.1 TetR/AcrR family transcriptional regulator [Paenibacillus apiarius]MCY9551852.1 TetR/AcrR family transcriptional regulator [Paenibacillus apiarius]MCY9557740.1 TetR/AcrR family transcriptional regulator [Paenibacillus apiarius]MCY9684427.1 TetR/AcrR family transcriptional regulator [Paenibacillus apiarius]
MARKAVDQELSRERILEVARHLFVTKGYRAISMRSIGQQLGYSHGSLYYHFKDKAELFYALVQEDFKRLERLFERVVNQAPSDGLSKMEQVMLEFVRFGLEHPHHYEIMFMTRDEELLAYARTEQGRCLEMFSTIVRQSLSGNMHSDQERHNIPLSLFLAMHGFISFYVQDQVTFEEVKPAALAHVRFLCRRAIESAQSA